LNTSKCAGMQQKIRKSKEKSFNPSNPNSDNKGSGSM
jgi:hypothetical protein